MEQETELEVVVTKESVRQINKIPYPTRLQIKFEEEGEMKLHVTPELTFTSVRLA